MKPTANAVSVVKKEEKPTTGVVLTVAANSIKKEEQKPSVPVITPQTEAQKPVPSISDLMEKAEKLHLLKEKYDDLTKKRKSLDAFEISHDKENAQIEIVDANGMEFQSGNPRCIAQVIDIWKQDYASAIESTEQKIRTLMGA